MPRKKYTAKNKYVWNSNISEEILLRILLGWCEHEISSETAKWVSQWASANGHNPITRESVSRYFNEFGAHLWVVSGLAGFLRGQTKYPPESIEARNYAIYQAVFLHDVVTQKVDVNILRKQRESSGIGWSVYSDLPVISLLYQLKNAKGFSKKWSHAYISRAFILSGLITSDGLTPEQAIDHFFEYMITMLEKYPLRKPFPEGEFLWSEGWDKGLDFIIQNQT